MTTEIEGVQDLLEELDSKSELGDLEWEIVDNVVRKESANKYLDDRITRALKDDKTIRVKGNTRADRYRRWARENQIHLKVRHLGNETFLWLVKEKEKSE